MELQTAQLGQSPTINLGGYIPAAQRNPSLIHQALAAFIQGAAGASAGKLVDVATTPDYSQQAQQEGLISGDPHSATKKFFAPVSAQDYERMKSLHDQQAYQTGELNLGKERNSLSKTSIENQRKSESDRMGYEYQRLMAEGQQHRDSLGEAKRHNQADEKTSNTRLGMEKDAVGPRNDLIKAETDKTKTEGRVLGMTARMGDKQNQAELVGKAAKELGIDSKNGAALDALNTVADHSPVPGDDRGAYIDHLKEAYHKFIFTQVGDQGPAPQRPSMMDQFKNMTPEQGDAMLRSFN